MWFLQFKFFTSSHKKTLQYVFVANLVRRRHLPLHVLSLEAQTRYSSRPRITSTMSSMRNQCQRQQLSQQLMNFHLYVCVTTGKTLQIILRLKNRNVRIHWLLHTTKCLLLVVTGTLSVYAFCVVHGCIICSCLCLPVVPRIWSLKCTVELVEQFNYDTVLIFLC